MFEGHPKGLWALALANTGERFGYYTMLAVFLFFLQDNFGFSMGTSSSIQATFLMFVYFVPLFGGMLADKFGFGKMVTSGIVIMFLGYLLLSLPLGAGAMALGVMALALLFICVGTGLFKGKSVALFHNQQTHVHQGAHIIGIQIDIGVVTLLQFGVFVEIGHRISSPNPKFQKCY